MSSITYTTEYSSYPNISNSVNTYLNGSSLTGYITSINFQINLRADTTSGAEKTYLSQVSFNGTKYYNYPSRPSYINVGSSDYKTKPVFTWTEYINSNVQQTISFPNFQLSGGTDGNGNVYLEQISVTVNYNTSPPSGGGGDDSGDDDGEIDYPTYNPPTQSGTTTQTPPSIYVSINGNKDVLSSGSEKTLSLTFSSGSKPITSLTCTPSINSLEEYQSYIGSNISVSGATITDIFTPGSYTFKITTSVGSATSTITFNEITSLTVDLTYNTSATLIDNYPEEYSLCKIIQELEGRPLLNNTLLMANFNNHWFYRYGNSLEEINNADYIELNSIISRKIPSFDIVDRTSNSSKKVQPGQFYQIKYKASYTSAGITQEKEQITDIFRYPLPVNNLSISFNDLNNISIDEKLENSEEFFNNQAFAKVSINEEITKNSGYSQISQVNILLSHSNNGIFNDYVSLNTYNSFPEDIVYNLDDTVIRGNYLSFGIRITDKLGQIGEFFKSENTNGKKYVRAILPYFGSTTISSTASSIITINNNPKLSPDNSEKLTLIIPTPYTFNKSGNSIAAFSEMLNKIDFINTLTDSFSINLGNNIKYENNSGYISITLNELKTKLSTHLTENLSISYSARISFKDDFDNECIQNFNIYHQASEITNSYLTFNFGAPPIMLDYDESKYYFNINFYEADSLLDNLSNNKYMINKDDILKIYFPSATDANGNNTITGYYIKIARFDDINYLPKEEDFVVLTQKLKTQLESISGSYCYNHTVNNYNISKFIRLGISAYDNTGLESNFIQIPITLVAGRIDKPAGIIRSYQKEDNQYTFNFEITDIGGNIFKNYSYADYPNLERTYITSKGEEKNNNISIELEYRTTTENNEILYESLGTIYENSNSYSSLINKVLTSNNINLEEIDFDNKVYFRIKIKVQHAIDKNLQKVFIENYSNDFIIYPSTPTVAYRKNHLAINTEDFLDQNELFIAAAGVDGRNIMYFINSNGKIHRSLNIETGEISGFIIDGGNWD